MRSVYAGIWVCYCISLNLFTAFKIFRIFKKVILFMEADADDNDVDGDDDFE